VLTRKDLISGYTLSLKTNGIKVEPKQCSIHCEEFLDLIFSYIKEGCIVRFQGCGALVVRQKKERLGFNPKTGEKHIVSGRRTCSMIKKVRSSAKGIIQNRKITTKQIRIDFGKKINNPEASEILINTFLRLLSSIITGREDRFMLQSFGSFSLRKKINEGCITFSPAKEIKDYLKEQG